MGIYKKYSTFSILCCVTVFLLCLLQPISSSGQKRFRESCTSHAECETNRCHKSRCECWELKEYKRGKKLEQYYDNELGMCLSRVGQVCTLEGGNEKDTFAPFRCIPDATCAKMNKQQGIPSTDLFGSCACKLGFQPSESGLRCLSIAELRSGQGPSSMDQVRPEGWNRSGSSSTVNTRKPYVAFLSVYVIIYLSCILSSR